MFIDLLIIFIFFAFRLPLADLLGWLPISPMLYRIIADSIIIISMLALLRIKAPLRNNLCGWKIPTIKDFAIGLVGAVVLFALVLSITNIIPRQFLYSAHLTTRIYQTAILLFITSLTEELFYRGYFLNKLLMAKIPQFYGVIISALLFGLGHIYMGIGGVLFSILAGCILGVMIISYKSITTSIVAHFVYNILFYLIHVVSNS